MSTINYIGKGRVTCPQCGGDKKVKCEKCKGKGRFRNCNTCGDTGNLPCSFCDGTGHESKVCPVCDHGRVKKTRWINCDRCHGKGVVTLFSGRTQDCRHCGGRGQVRETYYDICPNCHGEYKRKTETPCWHCNGTGTMKCGHCGGTGHAKCKECGGTGEAKCSKCNGEGSITVDSATTLKLMESAANEGNFGALHDLAIAYVFGTDGLSVNYDKAEECFRKLIKCVNEEGDFEGGAYCYEDSAEAHLKFMPEIRKGNVNAMRELAKWFSKDALEEREMDCTPLIEGRKPEEFWLDKAAKAEKSAKTVEETKRRNEENRHSCKANAALKRAEKSMSFLATVLLLTTAAFFAWWWIDGANVSAFNGIVEAMRPANGNESGIVAGMSLAILGNILLAVLLLPWALLNFFLGRKSERASFKSKRRRWIFKWLGALFGFIGIHLAYARRWGLFFLLLIGLFMWGGGNDKKHPQAATSEVNGEPTSTQIAKPFREREPQETQSNETSTKPQGQDEKKPTEEKDDGIFTSTNIGFAVWLLLWFGGTLFIKEDGSKLEM